METKTREAPKTGQGHQGREAKKNLEEVLEFKKRMLEWPNPVEYVNNMYGCHTDDDDNEYFKVVFAI